MVGCARLCTRPRPSSLSSDPSRLERCARSWAGTCPPVPRSLALVRRRRSTPRYGMCPSGARQDSRHDLGGTRRARQGGGLAIDSGTQAMGIHARLEPFRSTALRLARRRSLRAAAAPLFIGGTGGSGTRVVAQIVAHAGVFLGRELNRAGDSEPVGRYLRRWIPRYLRADGRVPEHERAAMNRELQVALIRHRRGIPARDGPWGAKNPRSMYLLPYLWERVPNLRFLHLVRNGLDMAFSRNQNQLQAYGALVLGEEHEGEPEPARSVALWAEANTRCHR
ncbi:MAG: sulfotransferase, partial [Gemmatimonadota bacterium]